MNCGEEFQNARAYRQRTRYEQIHDVGAQRIAILVQEAVHVVPDGAREVTYAELGNVQSRSRVQFVESVVVMAFLQERRVGRLRKIRLVVQQMKNTHGLLREQMNHWQIIL